MSHSSTSGILKALAELGEGVGSWHLFAAASRNAAIGSRLFVFFVGSLISFGPSCWEAAGRMVPRVADDDLACRPVLR
jgi:hypothetical protein